MNTPDSPPPVAPAKKGLSAIAWVGIGCGTILLIAVVVVSLLVGMCSRKLGDFSKNPEKAAAEMMVSMNPDLKKVSQDDSKGEMTIRTKDGQEMTLSYKDVSNGKFTIKDAKGNVTQFGQSDLKSVPEWVPRLPGMKTSTGSFHTQDGGKITGIYNATSEGPIDTIEESFKTEAKKLKMTESSRSSTYTDGTDNRILAYEGGGRKLTLIITAKVDEDIQMQVAYEETK